MSIETAKMSERGQIIIPKDIRDAVNATENTLFAVSTLDNMTIVMRRIDTKRLTEDFRKLRQKAKKMSEAEIEAEIYEARKT